MADVLKGLRMLYVVWHQTMLLGRSVGVARRRAVVLVLFVVIVLLAHEVLRTLVFVCAAILRNLSARPC